MEESESSDVKITLPAILERMVELEQLIEQAASQEAIEELKKEIEANKNNLTMKVDSYQYMISKFEAERDRLLAQAEAFAKAAKSVDASARRVESLMLWQMARLGFERLPGETFIAVKKISRKTLMAREPEPEDMIKYDSAVKLKLSWSITEAKRLAKTDEALAALIKVEETEKVKFDVRKEQVK